MEREAAHLCSLLGTDTNGERCARQQGRAKNFLLRLGGVLCGICEGNVAQRGCQVAWLVGIDAGKMLCDSHLRRKMTLGLVFMALGLSNHTNLVACTSDRFWRSRAKMAATKS